MRRECPKLSEDVIRTTECRNIGSKRMFRVTCSFSLKSLSHSSAITSFLLRYPDLVSPRTFSVKKFHRISWNHYLIGREYRQENYPEMWNLGSACRAMSAARDDPQCRNWCCKCLVNLCFNLYNNNCFDIHKYRLYPLWTFKRESFNLWNIQ